MSHCQLHPLLVNPVTGEPYLWLPSPLENIIITPPRMSDAPSMVAILNDPLVCRWILGPPYPYLPSHAESWLESTKKESDAVLQELEQASRETPDGPLKIVGACPVRILREVREDGTEVYLGDIGLRRCVFPHEEPEEQQRLSEKNKRRAVGDPELIWCIGGMSMVRRAGPVFNMVFRLPCKLPSWPRHHERGRADTHVGMGDSSDGCTPYARRDCQRQCR